jgi:hypothetical protein
MDTYIAITLHHDNDVAPALICKAAGMLDEYLKRRKPNKGKEQERKALS